MAIDRDALSTAMSVQGWTGTNRLIPADAPDAPAAVTERWAGIDMAQRKADAKRRIAAATRGQPVLRIALPKGPGADRLFDRLSTDLRDIGIKASLVGIDAPADLRLVDTVARYPRADWYIAQFSCALSRSACSAVADRFAMQARNESDATKRAGLLADAETALTKANVFIPLGEPIRWSLVRDPQPGFALNPRGLHPLPELALRPR
jgi:peptide/nickel transport system substrate-binding protein/oligopeptide transport system substrate-binding protein